MSSTPQIDSSNGLNWRIKATEHCINEHYQNGGIILLSFVDALMSRRQIFNSAGDFCDRIDSTLL